MTDSTSLGDRMKAYEHAARTVLPRRTYTVVRVDGRSFSRFLRHADKPFDDVVMAAMDAVAETLCADMSGAVLAYTQSDECSVLLTDFAAPGTQPWFGGVVQKVASVAASTASIAFNRTYSVGYDDAHATFDGRVFTVPTAVEAANYFVWRQRDAVRNSIAMAAQAHFSHRQLHRANTVRMRGLLLEKGVDWDDYPGGCKRGRVTVRCTGERDVTFTHRRTGEEITGRATRSWWETAAAPHFTAAAGGWLAEAIPPLPALTEGIAP
ncbi:tRNA(His) guanylyltransferase Thg1 family protein [Actinomadura sp. LOL_016]|uniref:tRNA(His) guanylyltransferase Thg1 family protein n=1 Tax=unclassified Actinomadura TaxID=2626254 RepID=UPI003A7FCB4A